MAIPKLDLSVGSTQTIYDWAGLTNDVIDAMNDIDADIDTLLVNINSQLAAQNSYIQTTITNFDTAIRSDLNQQLADQNTAVNTTITNFTTTVNNQLRAQNTAVATATNISTIFTNLKTVDGANSGLDADMLDSKHGSYYTDIPARLGFLPYTQTQVDSKINEAVDSLQLLKQMENFT